MGKGYRQGRLGEEIRKVISEMLLREVKDPRLSNGLISLSGVEVTSDGSYATCFVTYISTKKGEEAAAEEEEILEGLRSAKGLFK
ncbi:MAG: ribosome-binding factor A, partial [Clostridia bacterium]|nr:ribosome-binding factor A [Clostridia bacterium]